MKTLEFDCNISTTGKIELPGNVSICSNSYSYIDKKIWRSERNKTITVVIRQVKKSDPRAKFYLERCSCPYHHCGYAHIVAKDVETLYIRIQMDYFKGFRSFVKFFRKTYAYVSLKERIKK